MRQFLPGAFIVLPPLQQQHPNITLIIFQRNQTRTMAAKATPTAPATCNNISPSIPTSSQELSLTSNVCPVYFSSVGLIVAPKQLIRGTNLKHRICVCFSQPYKIGLMDLFTYIRDSILCSIDTGTDTIQIGTRKIRIISKM